MIRWLSIACVAWVAILAGCSVPERGPSVPLDYTERALPLSISNVRFFADGNLTPIIQEGQRAHAREEAVLQALGRPTTVLPPAHYLAISGGGANGAFGRRLQPTTSGMPASR